MTLTNDFAPLFDAVARAGAALVAALRAVEEAAARTPGTAPIAPSARKRIEEVEASCALTWERAFLAELDRSKGPPVMVQRYRLGYDAVGAPYPMEYARRTPARVVLRDEYGHEVAFNAGTGSELGRHSFGDHYRQIVDVAAAAAIEWKAPRPARPAKGAPR